MLGEELDQQVRHYLRELRDRGGIISTRIVLVVGLGVVTYKDVSMLAKYGGSVVLTKHWAKYLLQRMNMVKRRGNTKAKVTMEKFDELRTAFILDVKNVMELDEVPTALVVNWDHTAINYIPISAWTTEKEGAKRVDIVGKEDKKQITVVFACSMVGDFLSPQ